MDLQNIFTEAVLLHRQGRLDEALDRYRIILQALPDNVNLLGNLAIVCRALGRLDEALEYSQQAAILAPDDPDQQVNLGAVFESLGQTEQAIQAYETAHRLAPSHPKALNNLGKLYHLRGDTDRGMIMIRRALEIEPANPLILNNIGVILSDVGDHGNASTFLERGLSLDPNNIDMLFNLSGLYNCLGQPDQARQALERLLAVQPQHESARHMLAALNGAESDTAPARYITETFDKYAYRFDSHTQSHLGYNAPSMLAELLSPMAQNEPFKRVLDLGCGTGLAGIALQGMARHLTGIDLSSQMLDVAAGKNIYDELVCDDISAYLQRTDDRFDLVVAADVFIYVGRLEPLFDRLEAATTGNAVLACSIERLPSGAPGYELQPTGRFAHTPEYLCSTAERIGFTLQEHREHDLRKENGAWIPGDLFVFSRDSAPSGSGLHGQSSSC